jgi:dinuclear metal center YbgI/SA1388 family protein
MKLVDLINFLHAIAPSHLQEDYDNAGLITGHEDMTISGVLVCLDAIESIVDEAIVLGCNVIVAHHPIVFRGLKRFNGNNYVERTIIKAIKHDIAIFAIHTNLDNVFIDGVNTVICNKLGLINLQILSPKPDATHLQYPVGAGMVGELTTALSTHKFLEHLKQSMELQVIKHTNLCRDTIQKVAVCGGSGGFLLSAAKRHSADIFITADYKYHEYFDADDQIIIADIGHYESEKYTIDLLYTLIMNNFSTFATHYTKFVTNPIKYF